MINKKQAAYQKGLKAEEFAAHYLRQQGYNVLEMRYKTKYGEIDILASKRMLLAAVEVKSRKTIEEALYALSAQSRQRIQNSLMSFIADNPDYQNYDLRFDLFAYQSENSFEYLDNAWFAGS